MYHLLDLPDIDWGTEIEVKLDNDVVLTPLELTLILIRAKNVN